MKTVIQRNLPLNTSYQLVSKTYLPVLDGNGRICKDCGKLISYIATVKSEEGKTYEVGFDCLEKLLRNNFLLCNFNLETLKHSKSQINKIIRFSKYLKEVLNENPNITGILFEKPSIDSDWYTFYYLYNNSREKSRNNDSKKIKGIEYTLLHKLIQNILTDIEIYYQN